MASKKPKGPNDASEHSGSPHGGSRQRVEKLLSRKLSLPNGLNEALKNFGLEEEEIRMIDFDLSTIGEAMSEMNDLRVASWKSDPKFDAMRKRLASVEMDEGNLLDHLKGALAEIDCVGAELMLFPLNHDDPNETLKNALDWRNEKGLARQRCERFCEEVVQHISSLASLLGTHIRSDSQEVYDSFKAAQNAFKVEAQNEHLLGAEAISYIHMSDELGRDPIYDLDQLLWVYSTLMALHSNAVQSKAVLQGRIDDEDLGDTERDRRAFLMAFQVCATKGLLRALEVLKKLI